MKKMIRSLVSGAVVSGAVLFGAHEAAAQVFFKIDNVAVNNRAHLEVRLSEQGLEPDFPEGYTLRASVTVTYVCVNPGGNPSADPRDRRDVTDFVEDQREFTPDLQGKVQGFLTLRPRNASAILGCRGRKTARISHVLYSDVELENEVGQVTSTPDKEVFFNPPIDPSTL